MGNVNALIVSQAQMAEGVTSDPFKIEEATVFSIQAAFTGAPNGTLKLQASNDPGPEPGQVQVWTDIPNTSQAIAAAGNHMWNVQGAGYKWVRAVFTDAGGLDPGVISCRAQAKIDDA